MEKFKLGDWVCRDDEAAEGFSWWTVGKPYVVFDTVYNGLAVRDDDGDVMHLECYGEGEFYLARGTPTSSLQDAEEEDEGLDAEELLELVIEELRQIARHHMLTGSSQATRIARILGYDVRGNELVEVEWID